MLEKQLFFLSPFLNFSDVWWLNSISYIYYRYILILKNEHLLLQEEASKIKAAGKAWYQTMISDSDYTEFDVFSKWLGVSQWSSRWTSSSLSSYLKTLKYDFVSCYRLSGVWDIVVCCFGSCLSRVFYPWTHFARHVIWHALSSSC